MIRSCNSSHSYIQDWLDHVLARGSTSDTDVSVEVRELEGRSQQSAPMKLQMNMRKELRELKENCKEPVIGKDTINREMNLSLATCGERCATLLQCAKPGQQWFRISKQCFSGFSEMSFSSLKLEQGYWK